MTITILASKELLTPIQNTLANRGCVGVDFEYSSDVDDLMNRIDVQGFYMDKLVLHTALIKDYDDQQKQDFVDRLVAICDTLKNTDEIFLLDSIGCLKMEYANSLSFYDQVVYQSQKIHLVELLDIMLGDYKQPEPKNINKEVKRKGFFNRWKVKKQSAKQSPTAIENSIDVPLFQESVPEQPEVQSDSQSQIDLDDLDSLADVQEQPDAAVSDEPLFVEPQPQPQPQPQPEPQPELQPEPQPKHKRVKKIESSYVDIFQKRTKIILCTGERRSGVSTFVSNIAQQMQRDGLACLVVDLDYERRGQAINFPFEHSGDDVKLTYSLYNAVKSSAQIHNNAIELDEGLDFLGTSLYVEDTDKMHDYVSNESLQRLLTVALSEYDTIVVDCPFLQMKEYPCLIAMSNIIVYSTGTDLRSVYNAINALTEYDFLTSTDYNLFISKMMLLLNCYTKHLWKGKPIDENLITSVMYELTDSPAYASFSVLGRVPVFDDFDIYMTGGRLLVDKVEYKNIFVELLNSLAVRG